MSLPLPLSAFEGVKHGDVDLLGPKLIYVAINFLGLGMGLYKLGTTTSVGDTCVSLRALSLLCDGRRGHADTPCWPRCLHV